MKDSTEDSLIWMLIAATVLWQIGFGTIGLLVVTMPLALIAACVISRLTLGQKSSSLRK